MTVRLDPEQNESGALLRLVPAWEAKRTLEIGCGDGRLTFRYAAHAAQIEAIDPDEDDIAAARRATPAQLADRHRFLIAVPPTAQPPALEVRSGDHVTLAGWVHETDEYVQYAQADAAVQAVLRGGQDALGTSATFAVPTPHAN